MAPKSLRTRDGEIAYFRGGWQKVYACLLYYQRVQAFVLERANLSPERLDALTRREEGGSARFYRTNREFWLYYSSGSCVIGNQFIREYSRCCIYDPLCLVIDPAGAPLASYRAAWGLAFEWYVGFLKRVRE